MLIPHQKLTIEPSDILKSIINQPKNNLKKYIPKQNIYLTGSGRSALKSIIQSNNLKNIGIPAFTCCAVEIGVKSAKANPIFINSHIIPEIKDYPKIDALVLPYNFGFLPDIEKIKKECKKRNIILIEDCCQALGAKYKNKLAGSFGNYAFYSFGISKNIGIAGGALASNKKELVRLENYPKKEIFNLILKGFAAKYILNPKFYNKKLIEKELLKNQKDLNYKMPNILKKIILTQIKRYNKILNIRTKNGNLCLKELDGIINFVKPIKNTELSWLYFILLSKKRKEIIKKLLKEKVDLQPMLTFKDLSKNSPLATKAEKEHFGFALYRPEKEVEFIIKKIKKVMKSY